MVVSVADISLNLADGYHDADVLVFEVIEACVSLIMVSITGTLPVKDIRPGPDVGSGKEVRVFSQKDETL